MRTKGLVSGICLIVLSFALNSCSDLKDSPPTKPALKIEAHPEGWLDTQSESFHGNFIRNAGWDLAQCQQCHGRDYKGGITSTSCLTCHPGTPEDCTTCHGGLVDDSGAPPEDLAGDSDPGKRGVGAHQIHLHGGDYSAGFPCKTCHVVPDSLSATGHIDTTAHAEVVFADMAVHENADPKWNGQSCQNVYCHGQFGLGNQSNVPVWTRVDGSQAVCGSCHGLPPGGDHPAVNQCSVCHGAVVDADNHIIDKQRHINGTVEVGEVGDHDATNFPINSGTHQGVWQDCSDCHVNQNNFPEVSCLGCHEHEQASMETKHAGIVGFAYNTQNCLTCHPSGQKSEASFPEHDNLHFPIYSGNHSGQWDGCATCHPNSSDRQEFTCFGCHQHNQTDVENTHAGITGFVYESSACYSCHPTGESTAEFRQHDQLYFPIYSGNHESKWSECSVCHVNPDNRGDFSCFACHGESATGSIHAGITGYSYDSGACLNCHPNGDKADASFPEHDQLYFPIYSGNHESKWSECSVCHVNPDNRGDFSCFACHGESATGNIHAGITGYSYDSGACLNCHPNGDKADASFPEHDQLYFLIYSGKHLGQWQECAACHPDPANRPDFNCFSCHQHNQSDTEAIHSGIPGFVYDSKQCLVCHPKGQAGEFTQHDALYFPIYSGEHRGKWDNSCTTCHVDANDRSNFSCFSCHEHTKSRMDDKHKDVSGYVYESTACYGCHPNGKE